VDIEVTKGRQRRIGYRFYRSGQGRSGTSRLLRIELSASMLAFALVVLAGVPSAPVRADENEDEEPAPPEGQTYIGVKRCAACLP